MYPDSALTDICRQLLDEWNLTPEQIANLAKDIPGECAAMVESRTLRAAVDARDEIHEMHMVQFGGAS